MEEFMVNGIKLKPESVQQRDTRASKRKQNKQY